MTREELHSINMAFLFFSDFGEFLSNVYLTVFLTSNSFAAGHYEIFTFFNPPQPVRCNSTQSSIIIVQRIARRGPQQTTNNNAAMQITTGQILFSVNKFRTDFVIDESFSHRFNNLSSKQRYSNNIRNFTQVTNSRSL